MELQFQTSGLRFLQRIKGEIQTQEQTQELRLPEGMPDIGRVLCAWGQVLLRSKEWNRDSMALSGGIMVWVLYEPEEGGYPQTVEAWLPFQMKWDLPQTQHDGSICSNCLLRNVDARSTSARKLMIRANVSVLGEAYVPEEIRIYQPGELPEDICILKKTYPVELAREAGEKAFELDEELTLPASAPKLSRLIRFSLLPELIDRRVMSDKVVFRGMAIVHILYRGEDGGLYSWDFEVPFSQYSELDGEYGPDASARITPVLTALEMDTQEDGRLLLKAGLSCQYLIFDRTMLEMAEDAYSVTRSVTPSLEALSLPVVLDIQTQTIHAQQDLAAEGMRGADVAFNPGYVQQQRSPDGATLELSGQFQLLFYDAQGLLQCAQAKWEDRCSLEMGEDSRVEPTLTASGIPQAAFLGAQTQLRADCVLEQRTTAQQQFPMLTGLEIGENAEPDPNRPSLILRRLGQDSFWTLAKKCGSTVESIKQANGLEGEPDEKQLLLIPVL